MNLQKIDVTLELLRVFQANNFSFFTKNVKKQSSKRKNPQKDAVFAAHFGHIYALPIFFFSAQNCFFFFFLYSREREREIFLKMKPKSKRQKHGKMHVSS